MNSKLFVVAKYEYLRTVKRAGFIITTLFFPIFFGILIGVQILSTSQAERIFSNLDEEIQSVHIIDDSGLIDSNLVNSPFVIKTELEESINQVKAGEADALIYYPSDISVDGKYEVYTLEDGLLGGVSFGAVAQNLIDQSVVSRISDEEIKNIIQNVEFTSESIQYNTDGEIVKDSIERYIIPAVSAIVFFLAVFISAQYLLQSISKEKENRMIETILSMIPSRDLIYGKIIGLSGVVLTQIFIWLSSAFMIYYVSRDSLGDNFEINPSLISWESLPLNVYMTLMGFLLFAATMVGVGSVATSYKDSQSLSSVFIMSSLFPIYLITYIVADPNGPISMFVSYFPFTAPMILLIRNSLGVISPLETIIGVIAVTLYVIISFWIANKLFNLGSLMYNRRPTSKELLQVLEK